MAQERKAGQEAGEYVTAGGLVNGGAELVEFTLVGRPFVGSLMATRTSANSEFMGEESGL